jgi:hypothetical protein
MKHLVRLYPRRWRRRYEAEIAALVARERPTIAGIIDLIRGALDARAHALDGSVYVPMIGFRPAGTRTLTEVPSVEHEDTRLTVLAVAASPLGTDVLVEWHRPADARVCAPGQYLARSFETQPALSSAVLLVGDMQVTAERIALGAYGSGTYGRHAFHKMRFPAIDAAVTPVILRIREADYEFSTAVVLERAPIQAQRVGSSATLANIAIRVTAAAWHGDELTLNLEVTAPSALGQVGTAMPEGPRFGPMRENMRRARAKQFKRVMATADRPITLLDASGGESPELRRIHPPQSHDSVPTIQSFAVVFEAPPGGGRHLTLVVPFVELIDRDGSAPVDLRSLPTGFAIGGKQFTALSAEPRGSEMKVIVQVPRASGPRYVLQPAGILGSGGGYSWGRGPGDQVWFAAQVGDPPIVRFIGVVERVEGPWRIRVPLR